MTIIGFIILAVVLVGSAGVAWRLINTRGRRWAPQTKWLANYATVALTMIAIVIVVLFNFVPMSAGDWAQMLGIFIAVAAAIFPVAIQIKSDGFRNGVNLLLQLQGDYDKVEMRKVRHSAINFLDAHRGEEYSHGDEGPSSLDVIIVLNFFQTMAILVNNGALDPKMVWDRFYSRIYSYHYLTENYVNWRREQALDPTLWREFDDLYEALAEIHSDQCRRHNNGAKPATDEEAREALLRNCYELEGYDPQRLGRLKAT